VLNFIILKPFSATSGSEKYLRSSFRRVFEVNVIRIFMHQNISKEMFFED
jgi:hypothetical protein